MSSIGEEPTRCAFVVCRLDEGGEPRIVLMKDPRWADYTLIGGHEEPEDRNDLESTARRETLEELGCSGGCDNFRLLPLTDEIQFGPVWSKSANHLKSYIFKYYGIQFDRDPHVRDGYNAAGFLIKLLSQRELMRHHALSNVVKIFLGICQNKLDCVPLSWDAKGGLRDADGNGEQRSDKSDPRRMVESAP